MFALLVAQLALAQNPTWCPQPGRVVSGQCAEPDLAVGTVCFFRPKRLSGSAVQLVLAETWSSGQPDSVVRPGANVGDGIYDRGMAAGSFGILGNGRHLCLQLPEGNRHLAARTVMSQGGQMLMPMGQALSNTKAKAAHLTISVEADEPVFMKLAVVRSDTAGGRPRMSWSTGAEFYKKRSKPVPSHRQASWVQAVSPPAATPELSLD